MADAERDRRDGRFGGGAATGRTLERRVGKTRHSAAPPPTVGTSEQARWHRRGGKKMSKKVLGFTSRKWVAFWAGVALGVVFGGLAAC